MNFVITGGAGFIGSHVTEKLLLEGHYVTVVDNLTTGRQNNLPNSTKLKLLKKDILHCCSEDFVRPVHGIAHLAATASISSSWIEPVNAHHNNLSTTIAVIQLCQSLKIPRLVFTSSAAVYGQPNELPLEEIHPTVPLSPYGLHKRFGEQYVSLFSEQYGFSAVVLRLFNVFGSRQDSDSPYSGVISIFASAMRNNSPITIYGDGTQTRDFIYVKDVAKAFYQALTVPLNSGACLTCNIGTGRPTSLLQLIEALKGFFLQWNSSINFDTPRTGDIQHSWAQIDRAFQKLEFYPQWSLQSGLSAYLKQIESFSKD